MIKILLSIVFTTCILAVPAPPVQPASDQSQLQWNKLKENKTLYRFQSTLFNETILPFLNECYTMPVAKANDESTPTEILCSRYFDAILQLNSTNYIVDVPSVLKIRDQNNTTTFCKQKHSFPEDKFYPNPKPRDFSDSDVCGKLCLENDIITTKPICRFLVWMGEELVKNSSGNSKPVVSDGAPVAHAKVPPTKAPQVLPKAEKEADDLSQQAEKPIKESGKKPEMSKDDAVLEKADNSQNIAIKPHPSDNFEEKLIKSNVGVDIPSKQEEIPNVQKEEKKSTQATEEESKDDLESTKFNSIPLDETQLNTSPKSENPDSKEQEFLEDNDENADYPSNEKPKKEEDIEHIEKVEHPQNIAEDPFHQESGSNFFTYLLIGMFLCIALYVFYHNKSKILALLLEGRRGDKGRSGRRKHTAAYRKLDSNLEEAITSSASGRTTQIIY